MQKDLGANVEKETLRLTAKQDAEKIELLAEVRKTSEMFSSSFNAQRAGEGSVWPTGDEFDRADAEEQ